MDPTRCERLDRACPGIIAIVVPRRTRCPRSLFPRCVPFSLSDSGFHAATAVLANFQPFDLSSMRVFSRKSESVFFRKRILRAAIRRLRGREFDDKAKWWREKRKKKSVRKIDPSFSLALSRSPWPIKNPH